ncbi:MAG: hypothetical protein PVH63_09585 [Balneolaceae bacterium]|jgi:hypothetical protein
MKLKRISFILLAMIFNSCSIFVGGSSPSKIVGRWEWIRSSGGFGGKTITPDSTGVPNRYFNFNSDYTFLSYQADTLVQKGRYSLKEKDGDVIISYYTEDDNFSPNQKATFQGKDTLILSDECFDCYISTYIRAR